MASNKRWLAIVTLVLIIIIYIMTIAPQENINFIEESYILDETNDNHVHFNSNNNENWRHLTADETKRLSKLGRILFLNESIPQVQSRQEPYKILVWKYGPTIEKRHIYHFTKERHNPFEQCSVSNCVLRYKNEDLNSADIVIIHLHRTQGITDLPPNENRSSTQIWAFLTDESPYHTFLGGKYKLKDFNGVFNWSMTYRMDADIPVPYGRTIIKSNPGKTFLIKEFNEWIETKHTDVLVAIMGSNCGSKNHRWEYVKELKKYIKTDAYGACGTIKCAGHFESDCIELNSYMFYLSFENSNCDDYLTEKLWWNAYHKNSIPIIMGPTNSNLQKLLPPHSYISVEDFAGPRDLANYLKYVSKTPTELITYFEWKNQYAVLNEHGYFKSGSHHYCRVCEALHYNDKKTKVYSDLESFWSTKNCYPAWDANQ